MGSRQTSGDHADNLDRHASLSADGASPSLLDRVLALIPGGARASPTSAISMSDLRSNFDTVDALVSKGGVTLEESCAALESLGGSASDAEFLHRTLDLRGNGLIEFGELVSAIVLLSSEEGTEAYEGKGSGSKIEVLFRSFDADQDGSITPDEFSAALRTLFRSSALLNNAEMADLLARRPNQAVPLDDVPDVIGTRGTDSDRATMVATADLIADEIAEATFGDADLNEDGSLDVEEFERWLEHRESALFVKSCLDIALRGLWAANVDAAGGAKGAGD